MWPIFHGPVTLSHISKTIWRMSVIFSDNETVWLKLWPQSKYKSTWPTFHGLVILLNIFKDYLMDEHRSWYNGSVWHIHWPYQVYVGQWPIFYGPAILLHILKTIWWRNVVLGIMDHCDSKIDLVKYMWVSDLYFMVHWFYLISLSDLNYFYTLRNGTGRGIRAPPGTCSSFIWTLWNSPQACFINFIWNDHFCKILYIMQCLQKMFKEWISFFWCLSKYKLHQFM